VHTQEIHVTGGREAVRQIRWQLFAFPEVLDVLAISQSDSLVVVFCGRPRPGEWSRHLQAAGYEVSAIRAQHPGAQRDASQRAASGSPAAAHTQFAPHTRGVQGMPAPMASSS
jgi:hypothetical protein